jgi:hypothetical protein
MGGRLCENILNDPLRQFAAALILFLDNLNPCSRFNIRPLSSTHMTFHQAAAAKVDCRILLEWILILFQIIFGQD